MRVPPVLLLGSVLLGLGSPMSSSAFARVTWSEIGSIQILEGPERIWVFVEVVRITDYTDEVLLHLMSKHPDREIVSQTVFTIDLLSARHGLYRAHCEARVDGQLCAEAEIMSSVVERSAAP